MQSTPANRLLFTLLLATIIIPLPAMTPALLSGRLNAMAAVTEPKDGLRLEALPWMYVPARFNGVAAPLTPPFTMASFLPEPPPVEVISALPDGRAAAFEPLNPVTMLEEPLRPTEGVWILPVGPGGGGLIPTAGSSVPEPTAWSMMVIGFMITGLLLRRGTARRYAAGRANCNA